MLNCIIQHSDDDINTRQFTHINSLNPIRIKWEFVVRYVVYVGRKRGDERQWNHLLRLSLEFSHFKAFI